MGKHETVSLKDYIDGIGALHLYYGGVIREMETRWHDREASWQNEKFAAHNNLLRAWQAASAEDRATFVKMTAFDALADKFATNVSTTAKALTLAEGKSEGYSAVTLGVGFLCTVVIAFAAAWAMLHGR
jgi:hypothetical protein